MLKQKNTCPNCGTKMRRRLMPQRTIRFRFCDVCGLRIGNKGSIEKVTTTKILFAEPLTEPQLACPKLNPSKE